MASGAAGDLSQAHLSCAHFSIDKVPLYGLGYRIITLDGDARYWIFFSNIQYTEIFQLIVADCRCRYRYSHIHQDCPALELTFLFCARKICSA